MTKSMTTTEQKNFLEHLAAQPYPMECIKELTEGTGYAVTIGYYSFSVVPNKHRTHNAKARLIVEDLEFGVSTTSSYWSTDQAAAMLADLQQAVTLAAQLNTLIGGYIQSYERQLVKEAKRAAAMAAQEKGSE